MPTLKNRLEALEAKAPAGSANYCLVIHGHDDCANARAEAVASFTALYGIEPVNFINVRFVKPTGDGECQCAGLQSTPFSVTGPDAQGIIADLVKQADGTAMPVVTDSVQIQEKNT